MRIVAGKWRGRTIAAPDTMDTRPILDRAKVVLFDMLGHRLARPGVLPPIAVLDLFAGSGALGIEALSRGARYCALIEQSRPIVAIIRQNLDSLKTVDEAQVFQADAARWEFRRPPADPDAEAQPTDDPQRAAGFIPAQDRAAESDPAHLADDRGQYGLVFVDPPYRLLTGPRPDKHLHDLFGRLAYDSAIAQDAIIVVRHAAQGATSPDLSPLIEHESREVGNMILRFMVRPGSNY